MSQIAPPPTRRQRMQANARVTVTDREGLAELAGESSLAQFQAGSGQRQRISSVEHTHSPLVSVYDPQGNVRQVPAQNLNMVLDNGMDVECPLCGATHTDDGPNQCPARDALLLARCPICRKVIPEERATLPTADGDGDDAGFVDLGLPDQATREQQLRARVQLHATTYHPSEAYSRYGWRKPADSKE